MSQDLALLMPAARPDALVNPTKTQNGAAAGPGGFGNVLSDQMRQARPATEARADGEQPGQHAAQAHAKTTAPDEGEGQSLPSAGEELPRDGNAQTIGQAAQDATSPEGAVAVAVGEADQDLLPDQVPSAEAADLMAVLSQAMAPNADTAQAAEATPITGAAEPAGADHIQAEAAVASAALIPAVMDAVAEEGVTKLSDAQPSLAAATEETTQPVAAALPAMTLATGQTQRAAPHGAAASHRLAVAADPRARGQTNSVAVDAAPVPEGANIEEGPQAVESFAAVLAEKHGRESGLPQAMAAVGGAEAQSSRSDMSKPLSVLQDLVQAMDINPKGQAQAPQLSGNPAHSAAPGSASPASQGIPLPLQHPKWGDAMAERVVWLVNNQLQEAGLRLNPAHLGPIEVKISMENDQANILFTVQHGQVKEAVEAALPRLRDMLAQGGVQLQDANVSDQQARRDQQQASREYQTHGRGYATHEEPESSAAMKLTRLPSHALVDYYI